MAIPTAKVKVEILKVTGLPAVTLALGDTRYLRASFQAGGGPQFRVTGRSRPVPDAGGDFDLTVEASPWSFAANMNPGEIFSIGLESNQDLGDVAAPPPVVLLDSVTSIISDPWTSGDRTLGSGVVAHVRVTTTLVNPVDKAFLARAAAASKASGVLTVPSGYYVEIVEILGLYKPDPTATVPAPGSKYVPGYISNDNLGRIFTNRLPDGSWKADTQFIDVKVKITAFGAASLPAGAKVDWTIIDFDDPTNDSREFHRTWGAYVDNNDYDHGKSIGAHPGDNAGAFSAGNTSESKLFGAAVSAPAARWAITASGPPPSASSRTNANSPIISVGLKTAESSVRIHCTNVAGTNLLLTATLTGTPSGIPVFGSSTGVMTMWSRIDVEAVRMAGAFSLSGAIPSVSQFFLPACVQLDFQSERAVSGSAILDREEMATSDDDAVFNAATIGWINNALVFKHAGERGWFFLGSARLPSPLPPPGTPPTEYHPTTYKIDQSELEVNVAAPDADFVEFEWTDSSGTTQNVSFSVNRSTVPAVSGGKTKMRLFGNDVTPDFTGHDTNGSIDHATASMILFFPRHKLPLATLTFSPGGFGIPASGAKVTIFGPGQFVTSGVSPSVPNPAKAHDEIFVGRTVIFTHHGAFAQGTPLAPIPLFDKAILQTIVHEFTHAFGMPHKCGNWNWRTPREKSCCMNYSNTWLLDASKNVTPNTVGKVGPDMCGRHLMEIRRVHLHKNLGLKWNTP